MTIATLIPELYYLSAVRSVAAGSPKIFRKTVNEVQKDIVVSFEQPEGYYVPTSLLWLCVDLDSPYYGSLQMYNGDTTWTEVDDDTVIGVDELVALPAIVNNQHEGFPGPKGDRGPRGNRGAKGLVGRTGKRGTTSVRTDLVDVVAKQVIQKILGVGIPDPSVSGVYYGTGPAIIGTDAEIIAFMFTRTKLPVSRINSVKIKINVAGTDMYGWCMFPRTYLRDTEPGNVFMQIDNKHLGGWEGVMTDKTPGSVITYEAPPVVPGAEPKTLDFIVFRTTHDNLGDLSWLLKTF